MDKVLRGILITAIVAIAIIGIRWLYKAIKRIQEENERNSILMQETIDRISERIMGDKILTDKLNEIQDLILQGKVFNEEQIQAVNDLFGIDKLHSNSVDKLDKIIKDSKESLSLFDRISAIKDNSELEQSSEDLAYS